MFFKFQLLMKEDCFLTCLSKNIDLVVLDLQEKKIHREIYEQQDTFFEAFRRCYHRHICTIFFDVLLIHMKIWQIMKIKSTWYFSNIIAAIFFMSQQNSDMIEKKEICRWEKVLKKFCLNCAFWIEESVKAILKDYLDNKFSYSIIVFFCYYIVYCTFL